MNAVIDEMRPLTAGRLLTIRREVCAGTQDELEMAALCNARVLAESCYADGKPVFTNEQAVLEAMTFQEMEVLLEQLAGRGGRAAPPPAANPQFHEARFWELRKERT